MNEKINTAANVSTKLITNTPVMNQPIRLAASTPTKPTNANLIQIPPSLSTQLPHTTPLSDKDLFDLCQEYGKNAKLWMRKFAVLLPEVFKRNLYRKKGFYSIHEFAAKVAGMNYSTTEQILSLDRNLEGKPILRGLIEKYGWSKIRVVASVATPKTDKFWAEKIEILTKGALEVYVRDLKLQEEKEMMGKQISSQFSSNSRSTSQFLPSFPSPQGENSGLNNQPQISQIFPWEKLDRLNGDHVVNDYSTISIKLDPDTELKLRILKQKIEKEKKEPVTFNEVLRHMFEQLESQSKHTSATSAVPQSSVTSSIAKPSAAIPIPQQASRYIPVSIRRELDQKYQGKCAFQGCNKPSEVLHHTERFALAKTHDAKTIFPLCKLHHSIAHATLIKNEKESHGDWQLEKNLADSPEFYSPSGSIDQMTQSFKKF